MDNILKFFKTINQLKHSEREGWKRIGVNGVKDTIASHSYGATLLGWLRAKKEGMDENKIIKLLLMHDFIMAYIPDYTPRDNTFKDKKNLEKTSFNDMIKNIPDILKDEIKYLFLEYQDEKSKEAIFARECDKIDTLLQASTYSNEIEEDIMPEFLNSAKDKFKTKEGKIIYENIKNRHTSKNHND